MKAFRIMVIFVLARILPLVTTTPIPSSHSPAPIAIAEGSTGKVQASSAIGQCIKRVTVGAKETSLGIQNKWEQSSSLYMAIPPHISTLAGIPKSPQLRIGIPRSIHQDGMKSFNDILFMLRWRVPNRPNRIRLTHWISERKRYIMREDSSFVVEHARCRSPIQCTVEELVDAVEKHNNRFKMKPAKWEDEKSARKFEAKLAFIGSPDVSSAQFDTCIIPDAQARIVTEETSVATSILWNRPSYFPSIPLAPHVLRLIGLEESTKPRIGVPLSKHPDGVTSFNDIMFMLRGLIPDNLKSRQSLSDWISKKRREIKNKDPKFVVEEANCRVAQRCTLEDLRNAIERHNMHFDIPPTTRGERKVPSNPPLPVHELGQPPHPQLRNSYDKEILARLMPTPKHLHGLPSGPSGSGFGFGVQHHGGAPAQSEPLPHNEPERFMDVSGVEGTTVLRNHFHDPSARTGIPTSHQESHPGLSSSFGTSHIE